MPYRFVKLIDDTNLKNLLTAQEYQELVKKKRVGLRGAACNLVKSRDYIILYWQLESQIRLFTLRDSGWQVDV